ncbi:MAG: hypothetical protein LLF83_01370 [Methanobacterium sp.]|nr:hypothetical protein [Methanobacterium sp.]
MICPECGHRNRKYAGFCEECYADLRNLPGNRYEPGNRGIKTNLRIELILLVITIIIFFIIVNWILSGIKIG